MTKKLTQISFLFVFATLLVVIGHSDITLDYKKLWIFKWVYTFHMPLFFFVRLLVFLYQPARETFGALPEAFPLEKGEAPVAALLVCEQRDFCDKSPVYRYEPDAAPAFVRVGYLFRYALFCPGGFHVVFADLVCDFPALCFDKGVCCK